MVGLDFLGYMFLPILSPHLSQKNVNNPDMINAMNQRNNTAIVKEPNANDDPEIKATVKTKGSNIITIISQLALIITNINIIIPNMNRVIINGFPNTLVNKLTMSVIAK